MYTVVSYIIIRQRICHHYGSRPFQLCEMLFRFKWGSICFIDKTIYLLSCKPSIEMTLIGSD